MCDAVMMCSCVRSCCCCCCCCGTGFTHVLIVTHSSHYSLSLFTQLHYLTLQGLRGVAVTSDSADYDENYYVPEDYDEDYDLNFEEEPSDLDSFDEEDLDSDMELYGYFGNRRIRNFNGYRSSRSFNGALKRRAFRQLNRNGYIRRRTLRDLNNRQVRRVIRADGFSPNQARITRSGDLVIRRRYGGIGRRRRPRQFRRFRGYYD